MPVSGSGVMFGGALPEKRIFEPAIHFETSSAPNDFSGMAFRAVKYGFDQVCARFHSADFPGPAEGPIATFRFSKDPSGSLKK